MLRADGHAINCKRVQRLMRLMEISALGPKPRTTKPAAGHKIFPYLLRDMAIERPNQVWAADITYIPIGRGFLYLVAVIDWASRAVLAWRLSNTIAKRSPGGMSAKPTGRCRSASRRWRRR
jgi:putative transposase